MPINTLIREVLEPYNRLSSTDFSLDLKSNDPTSAIDNSKKPLIFKIQLSHVNVVSHWGRAYVLLGENVSH